jgi:hypothetical protein
MALAKAYTGIAIFEGSPIGIDYRNVDWVARDLGDEGAVLFFRQYRPDCGTFVDLRLLRRVNRDVRCSAT